MKVCSKCSATKPETEYFVKDKKSGRLHAQCKTCYKEHRKTYAAEHYKTYGDQYRARAKIRRIEIKRALQNKFIEYMQNKSCVRCGESDIRVLEFDHIDPATKEMSIARAMTYGRSWQAILSEIEKCQILCANCHKKRTAVQYGWFKALGIKD